MALGQGKGGRPIDLLVPKSEMHSKLLEYLRKRLETSERSMSNFYPRWNVNERKVQAYVNLPDYEKIQETMNKQSKPPKMVSIVVPYSYAVIQTVTTYLLHTFCGRSPIFQVSCYNGEFAAAARNLELCMQYNADHNRLSWQIYQALLSSQVYQVGIWRVGWRNDKKFRTIKTPVQQWSMMGIPLGPKGVMESREEQLVYSGNEVVSVDPFMFFPDPRVPMTEVARRGEFVFWRSFENKMSMRLGEKSGQYAWVDAISSQMPQSNFGSKDNSDRTIRSMGDGVAGATNRDHSQIEPVIQLDEGTCIIIPADYGLSESTTPEKWLFAIANKSQIVKAEPLEADHDMHPVAVFEPNAMGNSFGSLATADIIGPVQDHISWLLNSHMLNVRGAINNRVVVNPHYVEMKDLKRNPDEDDGAWVIRMKQSAFGLKPQDGLYQFQVTDVTSTHVKDMETMIRIGLMFVGANENLMGLQDARGRKTATEVRTAGEAGASRLAALARIIGAQGLGDMAQMMGQNLQQRMDVDFYNRMLGAKAFGAPLNPTGITGDFYYPMNDGTLPLDRAALLQVWEQILMGVAKDPELRQSYSIAKIFAFVADLGGARNIDEFKNEAPPNAPQVNMNVAPQDQLETAAGKGQIMPLPQSMMGPMG
jgi:hypothetical protein